MREKVWKEYSELTLSKVKIKYMGTERAKNGDKEEKKKKSYVG